MGLRRLALAATVGALALPCTASAESSLYHGPAPRPGPDILYRKPARSPQLANRGVWDAPPILISGASAYRRGEFVYQDYLYDDHGARGTARDQNDPRQDPINGDSFSAPNGTYTYPTDEAYANNAADLVELRTKPLAHSTAFRLTLNTMKDPSLVATTIAIGGSKAVQQFPHGANAQAPAHLFLTVHGHHADLIRAASGKRAGPSPRVSVSARRRQIEVRVPHSDWNPGAKSVRLAAGVGLWDAGAHRYLIPTDNATAHRPGGASGLQDPTAFFNVAFRFHEPWPDVTKNNGGDVLVNPSWWRDREQGEQLAQNDLGPFHAKVDYGRLKQGVTDNLHGTPQGVPRHGPMDRILASHFETEQGADYSDRCGSIDPCPGVLRGRLQPYAIYVPRGPAPHAGYGMTLLLHSLAAGYNQFGNSRNQRQFGERGRGSIVITPEGRGPSGWYYDSGGADTFEVWADVAHRFHLDPSWTAITGYSMGGYGTYKFATQFPDLFARAQPTVGPPGLGIWVPPNDPTGGRSSNTNRMLASVRHIPFLIWDGTNDELVPVPGPVAQAQTFDDLGYRYTFDLFNPPVDHFILAVNDQYAPAAHFLGHHDVHRNPAHVTYVVNPTMDFPDVGTVADHAYWLSGLALRDDSGAAPLGEIDANSKAFGVGDPKPRPTETGVGTLSGGTYPVLGYAKHSKRWNPAPNIRPRDALHLDATNIAHAVVNPKRAKLSCHPHLDVSTDGPLTLKLAGCHRTLHFGSG
jgi:hypothetical protein